MKKNFFKKLSFVLALAMIISVIAPAAGAFAAESLSLNATTTRTLHLSGQPGKNAYNFDIVGTKQKGWKYQWTSSNEAVATVASNGVATAKGIGTADLTVTIKDSKGAEVTKLTGYVSVKDNIETVKISNPLAADKTLKVNEAYDFNRTFTTLSGSTTKTTSVTRWTVDKAGATIDASGKFVATVAGQYKVTALAFQSSAKYDEWVKTNNASLVLDTDETNVTVATSITATKQVDADTFQVTFDSDMSKTDIKTAAVLYQVVAGRQITTGTEKIKEIKFDSTGKVVTVDMYTTLGTGAVYNFVYGKLVGPFTAATKGVDKIAGIVFDDFNVTVNGSVDMLTKVKAINADGVVIYDGSVASDATDLNSYVSFTYGGDQSKGYVTGRNVWIYTKDYAANVTAKFTSYVYNATTLTYDTKTYTDGAVATGVVTDTSVNNGTMQFQVYTSAATSNDNWKGTLSLAAQDNGYSISMRCKTNNDADNYNYTKTGDYTYQSSDPSKLLISGTSVFPIAQGAVTIIVKNAKGEPVSTFDVVISAARTFAAVSQSASSFTVGNNSLYGETGSLTVLAKDTTGVTRTDLVVATPSVQQGPSGANNALVTFGVSAVNSDSNSADYGKITVSATAKGAAPGAYYVKTTVTCLGVTKDVFFTVIVVDSNNNTNGSMNVATWKVEPTGSVDIKATYSKALDVKVNGYNAAGFKVDELNNSEFTYDVVGGPSADIKGVSASTIQVVTGTSGSAVVVDRKVGSYNVITYVTAAGVAHVTNGTTVSPFAGRQVGSYITAGSFSVTNSSSTSLTLENPILKAGNIKTAVQGAYKLKLNGTDGVSESNIISVKYNVGGAYQNDITGSITAGQSVYIDSFVYRVVDTTTNAYIDYTYTVGSTFAVQN